MGVGASIVPKQQDEDGDKKVLTKKQQKKADKIAQKKEWNKVVDDFVAQVLDETYLNYPIRATIIEAGTSPLARAPATS